MEGRTNKRISEKNKGNAKLVIQKGNDEEKKTKSEAAATTTITNSNISLSEKGVENMIVVGKSCNIVKPKLQDSTYRLHGCRSETVLCLNPGIDNITENKEQTETVLQLPSISYTSFISAQSDVSSNASMSKLVENVEDDENFQEPFYYIDKQLSQHGHSTEFALLSNENGYLSRLEDMEKKLLAKDKKIKELNDKIEQCNTSKCKKILENKELAHQVNLLNCQLQSMYELMNQKSWNKAVNPVEFFKYKNKTTELESVIQKLEDDKVNLNKNISSITSDLKLKDKELNTKCRELIDYKNRSTLEMCKLINKIDTLKRNIQNQSEDFDNKIWKAQNSLDDELVRITTKLEDQYQKDLKAAIEKLRKDFENFSFLPGNKIDKLIELGEPNSIEWVKLKQEWDKQEDKSDKKVIKVEGVHNINDISYEMKISCLKHEIEALSTEIKEKNQIIEIYESDLIISKRNSPMRCLKLPVEDLSYLKELYTTEIFAQKQVHKLEMDVFEERVRTLSNEILYLAKNEEKHFQELESARKMAYVYREKYENFIMEWSERVEKNHEESLLRENVDLSYLDGIFDQMKNLIDSLKKVEEIHELRVKNLMLNHDDEMACQKRDIEVFKCKITDLEHFQSDQLKLDSTIQELIENVGINYVKTVEALVTSHVTELSLKQLEMCATEKMYLDKLALLEENHKNEVGEYKCQLQQKEESQEILKKELDQLKGNCHCHDVSSAKIKAEEISIELLKCEGMMAMKEETEQALTERVKELEDLLMKREENCRNEKENLLAELVEINVMSAAKEELARELEKKLNDSEKLVEKSWQNVDALYNACSILEYQLSSMCNEMPSDKGDAEMKARYLLMKTNGEQLKNRLMEIYEKLDFLEEERKCALKYNECKKFEEEEQDDGNHVDVLEEGRKVKMNLNAVEKDKDKDIALEENNKLRKQYDAAMQVLFEKDRVITNLELEINATKNANEILKSKCEETENKLMMLESERATEEVISAEKEGMEEKNKVFEENLRDMRERMNEIENNARPSAESNISLNGLREVRVLYTEEAPSAEERNQRFTSSATTFACQEESSTAISEDVILEKLQEENKELKQRNKLFRSKLCGSDQDQVQAQDQIMKSEDLLSLTPFREQLPEVVVTESHQDDQTTASSRNLQSSEEKRSPPHTADAGLSESKINKMRREIAQLNGYIRTLTEKLDEMRANNERLLTESIEHLKNNQNLTNELEEAWLQRYEVEDQLTKARQENALLNLHASQLEETNRRISNLITESKPSVVSWIQVHETVENIVDGVLALKTSFDGLGSTQETCEFQKTQSDLKLTNESLNAQLQNKSMLCDELLVQKKTLEKELENLEELLKINDTRIFIKGRFSGESSSHSVRRQSEAHIKQSRICPLAIGCPLPATCPDQEFRRPEGGNTQTGFSPRTLNLFGNPVENQVGMEETQFCEKLEQQMELLKKEVQNLELNLTLKKNSLAETGTEEEDDDDERELALIEVQFDEEMLNLMKEFEKEIEKLRPRVDEVAPSGEREENTKEQYFSQVEKIKEEFGTMYDNLKKKYQEIYNALDKKRLRYILERERENVMSCFQKIIRTSEGKIRELQLENFLNALVSKYIEELHSIRHKYKKKLKDHASEVENLRTIIERLRKDLTEIEREDASTTKNKSDSETLEELNSGKNVVLEKEELRDLLQETKKKHAEEILKIEQVWTEKLNEFETRYEETWRRRKGNQNNKSTNTCECDNLHLLNQNLGKMQDCFAYQDVDEADEYITREPQPQRISHVDERQQSDKSDIFSPCLGNKSYFSKTEVETDDDKLQIAQERDSLKETVASLRLVVTNLLNFIGQSGEGRGGDANNTSLREFNGEETLYRSLQVNADHNPADVSRASNLSNIGLNLSNIVQEINEHSLLNSTDQVRFELQNCLRQLKEDATGLLLLSKPDVSNHLIELIGNVEIQKNDLQKKVQEVEKMHGALKEDIENTKSRLVQWERNLEVISEGYGEEVIEPKKSVPFVDLKNKMKLFLAEHCEQSPQDANILEELCKEGCRLQEEWKKEKIDLQQQIDVADKQLHSLRKFMEEQAAEREQEREAFDKEINILKESLKAKERDNFLQSRTNREVEALDTQIKDLTAQLSSVEKSKKSVELEFQNAVKKIWSLREVIQDLEVQLAEINERESDLKNKVERLDCLVEEQAKINADLKNELDSYKNDNELKYADYIREMDEERMNLRRIVDQVNPDALAQMRTRLRQIETILMKKTKDLEQMHVLSTTVSCSSPSEDISLRDHIDVTRCSTPDEMCSNVQAISVAVALPLEEVDRLYEKFIKHTRAEEVALKCIEDLKMQLRNNRKICEELETERDVLLERADLHLKENSSLKARLEEQRCNAALVQKQLNADLESQIKKLETELEKLSDLCQQKDKQLCDVKEMLENTNKALNVKEEEVLKKKKEENALISTLKADLENAISSREKLEENLEQMKEKLEKSFKIPALLDSLLEEKNAEIDKLEKEVLRLSTENSSLQASSAKESTPESNCLKRESRIKFSEPISFGECISTISPYNPSTIRDCSESFADLRNSSFKIRQPPHYSKMESLSSIGPLQLSPRGTCVDIKTNWKTSSPVVPAYESPIIPEEDEDFNKMADHSKSPSEIKTKQVSDDVSELKVEIDTYKGELAKINEELEGARRQELKIQQELQEKKEEINTLQNNESQLLLTIDSLKRNHTKEVEELRNKLSFEHGKVEKVFGEIKTLEVKKIEIEEAFISLKEDYNEKLEGEQKMIKRLLENVRDLELKNSQLEEACADVKKEMANIVKESKEAMTVLYKQLTDLRKENEALKSIADGFQNAEIQVDLACCQNCKKANSSLADCLERLKSELEKITRTVGRNQLEADPNMKYILDQMNKIQTLVASLVSTNTNEVTDEIESNQNKTLLLLGSSVDELAIKVQNELLLSAKLDNELLSNIEAKGVVPTAGTTGLAGEGDGIYHTPPRQTLKTLKEEMSENASGDFPQCQECMSAIKELETERDSLMKKVEDHERIIKFLEENLLAERDRILAEKERCKEDAKIMELLRVNLEKGLLDIKSKDKELQKERQVRMGLEKDLESLKGTSCDPNEGKKVADMMAQLHSQEEKILRLSQNLEDEKKKNQELRLLFEQSKIERVSEREAQKLLESDFNLFKKQKENFKAELIKTKLLLHSREKEINLLKRKINLQEIDIKALSISSDLQQQMSSDEPTVSIRPREEMSVMSDSKNDSAVSQGISRSLLRNVKKLNTCVERHVQESNQMGEALLHLTEETEHMRDLIKKMEENSEVKLSEETLIADAELERKLWNLERGKLLMDAETLRTEKELAKRESLETAKANELLKLENCKLKAEVNLLEKEATGQIEVAALKDRINHLLGKYLRAESCRKALIWQKQYLTVSLNSYRSSEETWRKMGKLWGRRRNHENNGSHRVKFRVLALAVVAVFRMKYVVRRRQRHKPSPPAERLPQSITETIPTTILSIYNDPIAPLSYQTHSLCRRTSTRVLRTPPSRDPGLQTYTPEIRLSDCVESMGHQRQEAVGAAQSRP